MADKNKFMRDLLDTSSFRGTIGDHPQGKLAADDDGALQFAVGDVDGKVVIDFGTLTKWLAMSPQDAANLASVLLKRARHVARETGQTIEFRM